MEFCPILLLRDNNHQLLRRDQRSCQAQGIWLSVSYLRGSLRGAEIPGELGRKKEGAGAAAGSVSWLLRRVVGAAAWGGNLLPLPKPILVLLLLPWGKPLLVGAATDLGPYYNIPH